MVEAAEQIISDGTDEKLAASLERHLEAEIAGETIKPECDHPNTYVEEADDPLVQKQKQFRQQPVRDQLKGLGDTMLDLIKKREDEIDETQAQNGD